MDNLLGTGGATASRLTLPQKIIATGMSVILAFGLSPIGQAPAYAKEKAKAQATEQVVEAAAVDEAVEAQAEPEGALEIQATADVGEWTPEHTSVVYDGKAVDAATAKQRIGSIVVSYKGTTWTLAPGDYSVTWYKASDTAKETELEPSATIAAGEYIASVTNSIALTFDNQTFAAGQLVHDLAFAVTPYDIAGATTTGLHAATNLIFNGKTQNVTASLFATSGVSTVTWKTDPKIQDPDADEETGWDVSLGSQSVLLPKANYAVTLTPKSENLTGSVETTVTVDKGLFSKKTALLDGTYLVEVEYAGLPASESTVPSGTDPIKAVTYNGYELTRGVDYDVVWKDASGKDAASFQTAEGTYNFDLVGMGTLFDVTGKIDGGTGVDDNTITYTEAAASGTKPFEYTVTTAAYTFNDVAGMAVAGSTYVPVTSATTGEPAVTITSKYAVDTPDEFFALVSFKDKSGATVVVPKEFVTQLDCYDAAGAVSFSYDYKTNAYISGKTTIPTAAGTYSVEATIVNPDKQTETKRLQGSYVVSPLAAAQAADLASATAGQFIVTNYPPASQLWESTYGNAAGIGEPNLTYVYEVKSDGTKVAAQVTEDTQVAYKSDAATVYNNAGMAKADSGAYSVETVFGTLSGTRFTASKNITGSFAAPQSWTVKPFDLATATLATTNSFGTESYTGLAQFPTLKAGTFTVSTGALDPATLKAALKSGELSFECNEAQNGAQVDADGKPLGAGSYLVTLNGAGKNYKGTIARKNFVINSLNTLPLLADATHTSGWVAELYDADLKQWVVSTGDNALFLAKGAKDPDYRVAHYTWANEGDEETPDWVKTLDGELQKDVDYSGKFTQNATTETQYDFVATTKGSNVVNGNTAITSLYKTADKTVGDFMAINAPATATFDGSYLMTTAKYKVVDKASGNEVNYTDPVVTKTIFDADGKEVGADGIVHAGTYTLSAKAAGYAGALAATFTVAPYEVSSINYVTDSAKFTNQGIEVLVADELTYTGGPLAYVQSENIAAEGQQDDLVPAIRFNGENVAKIPALVKYSAAAAAAAAQAGEAYKWDYKAPKYSSDTIVDAGDYSVAFAFSGDLSGNVTKDFTIDPLDISDEGEAIMMLDGIEWDEYAPAFDGLAKEPVVTFAKAEGDVVKVPGAIVVPADAIEVVTYENNVNASYEGVAEGLEVSAARVTAVVNSGNVQGKCVRNFRITPVSLTAKGVAVAADDAANVYTGSPIEPKFSVTYTTANNVYTAVEGKDYIVKVTTPATNVGETGSAQIISITGGNFDETPYFVNASFTVQAAEKKEQTIEASDLKMTYGDAPKAIGAKAQTALTYTPDNSGVVKVDADGKVTALKAGTAKVKITAAETDEYKAAEKEITVTVAKAKNTKFKVTAKDITLKGKPAHKKVYKKKALYNISGAQGKVTFKKANKAGGNKIVVKKKGGIVLKKGLKVGTYKVKVQGTDAGNANYEKATSKAVAFKVVIAKKKK